MVSDELSSYWLPNLTQGYDAEGVATPTATRKPPASSTPTTTNSPSPTATPTGTRQPSASSTPTATNSPSPTATDTPTPTATDDNPPSSARVVHVHNPNATSWNGQTNFWDYVSQSTVDDMVDQGIMVLTGTQSLSAAWQAILPNYQPGQGIAIKVNLNNAPQCTDTDAQIDALMEPVNAVVRGLLSIDVQENDIWVYEAKRAIPYRFSNASQYSNIRFFGKVACGYEYATFASGDPNAVVIYSPPAGVPLPPTTRITDVLIGATYLINVPIMKTHPGPGVTLSFKNHLGTIDAPAGLHPYISLAREYFRTDYNPMVDLYKNPHIRSKTILTIGDGLFAAKDRNTDPPAVWQTFGNDVPNSLFFSTDPVAIDCVMCDFLTAETGVVPEAAAYLEVAHSAGLGVFERGDPWGSGYDLIEFVQV
ncbi:MAG: DUF362 domain-containing protein [Anaerolineae bacterium]|nr:DUF362 domain-containing protein [Anaerolineae bacterium]